MRRILFLLPLLYIWGTTGCHSDEETSDLWTAKTDSLAFEGYLKALKTRGDEAPESTLSAINEKLDSLPLNASFQQYRLHELAADIAYQYVDDSVSLLHRYKMMAIAESQGWHWEYARKNLEVGSLILYQDTAQSYAVLQRARTVLEQEGDRTDPKWQRLETSLNLLEAEQSAIFDGSRLPHSIELLYHNIDLFEAGYNRAMAVNTYYLLGCNHMQMEQLDQAEWAFQKARAESCMSEHRKGAELRARSIHWVGIIYKRTGDTAAWESLTLQAIALFESIGSEGILPPLQDMIEVKTSMGKVEEAERYMAKLIPLAEEAELGYHRGQQQRLLANLAAKTGNYKKAIQHVHAAMELDSTLQTTADIMGELAQYQELEGDYEAAYHTLQSEFKEYKSRINSQQIREAEQYKADLTLAGKEREAESLRYTQSLQEARLKTQQVIIMASILGMILMIGLAIYLYRLWRELQRANLRLTLQAQELSDAKEVALDASRAKAEFLSVMSHEIRTPLNAVVGMTHLLMEESPRPDQVSSLQTLQFSSNHLLSLINDILDFSKIESGKLKLEHIPFNIQDLLTGIQQSLTIKAQEKGIQIDIEYRLQGQRRFEGDPVRLSQILTNLAGNAVKFTEEGKVVIRVSTQQNGWLLFEVIDTGIGIALDQQARIFEEFSQASADTTRKYGGTGLGLAITKKLLELMESKIELSSELGKGSNFHFTLDLPKVAEEVVDQQVSITSPSQANPYALGGLRVLLAEDNRVNQKVVLRFLQKWGIITSVANNGAEAVSMIQQQPFDLILMDMRMPVMDGLEATRQIRQLEDKLQAQTPIIALTASALQEEIREMDAAGIDGLVLKPFDPALLQQAISRVSPLKV